VSKQKKTQRNAKAIKPAAAVPAAIVVATPAPTKSV